MSMFRNMMLASMRKRRRVPGFVGGWMLFKANPTSASSAQAVLYDLRIYDHSLTSEELQIVKDDMMRNYEKNAKPLDGVTYVADWDAKGRSNDEDADVRSTATAGSSGKSSSSTRCRRTGSLARGTESLYTEVTESHAGTKEDPIPYGNNMELEEGKYYSQDGVTYICTRDTGIPVYNPLADLVGIYVEVAA